MLLIGWAEGLKIVLRFNTLLSFIPIFQAIGILIYFNTEYYFSINCCIGILCILLLLLLVIKKYYKSSSYIFSTVFYLIVLIFGYICAEIRVDNIEISNFASNNTKYKIIGVIDAIEIRENQKKLLLKNVKCLNCSDNVKFKKIKLVTRTKINNAIKNDTIKVEAVLMPPPSPILPGSFDYSRYAFFYDISAIGYAVGNINILKKGTNSELSILDYIKKTIYDSFYNNMEHKHASIANALFLGDTKKLDNKTYDDVRISGIAHLLAISGMHIALVAGISFFSSTLILSKFRNVFIVLNRKKFSAVITIFFSLFYLFISGSPISAQRAFIMTLIVMLGIIIDRETSPLRTLIFAAMVIMVITPETLLSASLQMSFSACLSLVYGFKLLNKFNILKFSHDYSTKKKISIYFFAITLSSLFATLGTSIFIIYHFQNFCTYGILTNLIAIPLTEFIIMPAGIIGIFLIPFNLDSIIYYVMEIAIEYLLVIAKFIASLPYSIIKINFVSDYFLLSYSIGFILLCTLEKKKKYYTIIPLCFCLYSAFSNKTPDIVISNNAKMVAVKDINDKKLYLIKGFNQRYAKRIWEQNLNLKKIEKSHLKSLCKNDVCRINDLKATIITNSDEFDILCNQDTDIWINLSNNYYECKFSKLNINKKDLLNNGTYMIWLDEMIVKNNKKLLLNKKWENAFKDKESY
ncbi:MAG: competence protein ComEC [Candidatus Midichloriaceae bacterium]|jgi:competence protein ComEC